MSTKRLNDFLPERKTTKTVMVQARVPSDLHAAVKEQISEDRDSGIKMDWTELVSAACRAYLSERGIKQIP